MVKFITFPNPNEECKMMIIETENKFIVLEDGKVTFFPKQVDHKNKTIKLRKYKEIQKKLRIQKQDINKKVI